jgi:hypothetical protein
MDHRHRRLGLAFVVAVALTAAIAAPAAAGRDATYRVTIIDLAEGQPLTPPLLAFHRAGVDVFSVGRPASFGVKEIAENGNLQPLHDDLAARRGVRAIFRGTEPLVPLGSPGNTEHGFDDRVTFTITTDREARFVSWVSMLICTNDGFTGLDRVRLPTRVGSRVAIATAGYDAGTEVNTEAFADIVQPCQALMGKTGDPGTDMSNPDLAEHGVIHHHPGIEGDADLDPDVHGWDDPVAVVIITRIG